MLFFLLFSNSALNLIVPVCLRYWSLYGPRSARGHQNREVFGLNLSTALQFCPNNMDVLLLMKISAPPILPYLSLHDSGFYFFFSIGRCKWIPTSRGRRPNARNSVIQSVCAILQSWKRAHSLPNIHVTFNRITGKIILKGTVPRKSM